MEKYGKYTLLSRLATGGMARVYLAREQADATERLLVVKRILPHLAENEEFVRMFLQEARVAARLHHPNIAGIMDLGAVDGRSFFIAMEYVHGEDVRRVVRRAQSLGMQLALPLACRIVAEAAGGLDHAHSQADEHGRPLNIVHRDVSPQNILVTFEGGVKVIDFGIAKAADSASNTRTGVLKGKYSYMSPEQARGAKLDRRSDVFALGIVLFELCTRQRLFKRTTDLATVQAVTACKVPAPSGINPEIDPDLEDILLRALAKEADQRTATAGQLRDELAAYVESHKLPGSLADLGRFMKQIYADRLAEEARLGHPIFEAEHASSPSGGQPSSPVSRPGSAHSRRAPPPVPSGSDSGPVDPSVERRAREVVDAALPPRPESVRRPPRPRSSPGSELAPVPRRVSVPVAPPPLSPSIERGDADVSRIVRLARNRRAGLVTGMLVFVVGTVAVFAAVRWGTGRTGRSDAGPERAAAGLASQLELGSVKLDTTPPGAAIVIDGRKRAETTPTVVELATGQEHEVVFTMPGYEDELASVLPRPGKFTSVVRTLRSRAVRPAVAPERPDKGDKGSEGKGSDARGSDKGAERPDAAKSQEATLAIASTPTGLVVEIDGKGVGRTPVAPQKLAPGRHQVRFLDPLRFLDQSVPVELEPGQARTLDPVFQPRRIRFVVKPSAEVYIHERKFADSPGDAELFPGVYRVTYSCPELPAKRTETLVVKPDPGPLLVKLELQKGEGM